MSPPRGLNTKDNPSGRKVCEPTKVTIGMTKKPTIALGQTNLGLALILQVQGHYTKNGFAQLYNKS